MRADDLLTPVARHQRIPPLFRGGHQADQADASREPNIEVSLGFNVPFDVRVARLSNVGEVKCRFVNEAGTGIG